MFFLKLLAAYELFCVCSHSLIIADKHNGITLKKTRRVQSKNIIHGVSAREAKYENKPDAPVNAEKNITTKENVKEISGSRRYLGGITGINPHFEGYPAQPHPIIHGPFFSHHVHFVPKPYPVVSVQYVPKPVPIPYAVPSHVHVSHLHLRPKCEYKLHC